MLLLQIFRGSVYSDEKQLNRYGSAQSRAFQGVR